MSVCETLSSEDRLIALSEGFLTRAEVAETESHAASCPPCAEARELVDAETEGLSESLAGWVDALPVSDPPPVPRRRPGLALVGLAAAACLLAAVLLAGGTDPAVPAGIPEISVAPAAAPGIIAPPTISHSLLLSDYAATARVEAVNGDRITVRMEKALHGALEELPPRLRLVVPRGISEIGVQAVEAKVGDPVILLLERREGRLGLTTGNAYSLVGPEESPYLASANLKYESFEAMEKAIARSLRYRRAIAAKPWAKSGALLSSGLLGEDPIAREMALDWYTSGRRGVGIAATGENRKPLPALETVDLALLRLADPGEDDSAGLAWSAQDLLMLEAGRWVARLASPEHGRAVWRMIRRIAERGYSSHRDALAAELRKAADSGATSGYLSAGLLFYFDDWSRLGRVLAIAPTEADRERLSRWARPAVWPPLRYVSHLAGQKLADESAARKWIESLSQK